MDLDSCLNFFLGLCTKVQSWWSSSYKFPPHPCTSLYFSPPYVSVVRLFLRFTTLCHKDLHTCQCLHRAGVDIAPSHFNMGHIICLNDTYYLSLRCLKSKIYYIEMSWWEMIFTQIPNERHVYLMNYMNLSQTFKEN